MSAVPFRRRLASLGLALLFLVIALPAFAGAIIGVRMALGYSYAARFLSHTASAVAVFLISWLFCRVADRRPWVSIGYRPEGAWRRTWQGMFLGAGMLTAIEVLGLVSGSYRLHWNWSGGSALIPWLLYAASMAMVGFAEEGLFRGYLLQRLGDAVGTGPAVLITSLLFAAVHLGNPGAGWGSTLGLTAIGALFAYLVVATGSMWMAMAVHMSWNIFEGVVYGLPNSGVREPISILATAVHGPAWWTGGTFGPEAGLLSTLALVLGLLAFLRWFHD